MKIQGTPEEMEQAKNWWADQKKRIDEEYKEAKRKTLMLKKIILLLALKTKKEHIADTRLVFHKSKEIKVKSI